MDPALFGAFFSGVAAVIGSIYALRMARRRCEAECERRIAEMKQALRTGFDLAREK